MHIFTKLTFIVVLCFAGCTCDWHGRHDSRRIGDPIALGEWTVEIRQSSWNQGVVQRSGTDTWNVHTGLSFIRDGEPQAPLGHARGLCGGAWSERDHAADEARAKARAMYERDPDVRHCVDGELGVLVASCLDSNGARRRGIWLVVWAQPEGVVYAENVNGEDCQQALSLAREQGPPERGS